MRIARTWEPIFSSIVSCHNRMSRVVLCTATNVTAIWGCYSSAVLTCSKMFNIFHHLSAKRMASSHGFPTASSPQSTAMCWAPDIGNHEILEVWTGVNNRTWRFNMLFHAVSSCFMVAYWLIHLSLSRDPKMKKSHTQPGFSLFEGRDWSINPAVDFQTLVIAKLSSALTQIAGRLDIPHRKHCENTHGGIFSFNPKPQIKQLFWGIHWIHQFQEFLPRLSSES